MYQVSNSTALLRAHRRLLVRERTGGAAVPRTVFLLGLTSLFTDISSEMVVTILPLYLVYVGGFTPLAFGVIDGIYNGAAALVGLASGFVGDRFRRHKEVATAGYGLSAVCKLLLATVGTALSAIGATVLIDRIGKGIRTAPRDAMISLSTPERQLGAAFGVHRALDTTGAMIGPLLAFGLLALAPLAFNSIFLVSFFIALIGLGILVLLVQPKQARDAADAPSQPAPSLRAAVALLAPAALPRAPDRRRRAEPGHGERRLRLPRPAGQARPRQLALPAALRGQRDHLHGARGADGQARRPLRPRPRVPRRLRAAASRSTPRCCRR